MQTNLSLIILIFYSVNEANEWLLYKNQYIHKLKKGVTKANVREL